MSGIKRQERIKANKEKRRLKREQVAQERADRLEALGKLLDARDWRKFTIRGPRRGDALNVTFHFSGIPVSVENPDNPDGKVVEMETQAILAKKDSTVN